MKSIKALFFFVFLFFLSGFNPARAAVLSDSFHREISEIPGITSVTLDNVNGDCHFFLAPKQKNLTINATITVKGPSDEACESYYQKVRIEVTRVKGVLKIQVNKPRSSSFFGLGNSIRLSVDFEISIPVPVDVSVNLVNGNIHMEGMGKCSVDLVNGKINMEGVSGASIEAVNSCMEIRGLKIQAAVDAVNGSLNLVSASPALKQVKAEFVNGRITVRVPCGLIGQLKMSSATGTAVLKKRKGPKDWTTQMRGKRIHVSDRGKTRISLENVNGKITLLCE
ncbi:MAG: DUF4097 domain-containing protein [Acidobacteria bacterium]|nr:DUF4097 domain-containing protein [Acidobacteriota bacterium]